MLYEGSAIDIKNKSYQDGVLKTGPVFKNCIHSMKRKNKTNLSLYHKLDIICS